MKKLSQTESGAKTNLVNRGEVVVGKVDVGRGKFDKILVLSEFENQLVGRIDNGNFGLVDKFGFFLGNVFERIKVKEMNRRDIEKNTDIGLNYG